MTSPVNGYTVTSSALRSHATTVAQLATLVTQAVQAAEQATLGDDAFGHLPVSAAFSALVKLVASPGISALNQAGAALSLINTGVQKIAANYDTTEQNNKSKFAGGTR